MTTAHDLPKVLTADLAVTRELCFGGKLCIHPRQVDAVNVALAPSDPEIAWARRILAQRRLPGVRVSAGLTIDAPVIARAKALLGRVRL